MNAPGAPEQLIGPDAAFEAWARAQIATWDQTKGKEGLSEASAKTYHCIWQLWCEWLDGRPEPHLAQARYRWWAATPGDVDAFVRAAPKNTTRPAKLKTQRANFSRQRYWRVLHNVYAKAVADRHLDTNPAAFEEGHEPKVNSRDRKPQRLPAGALERLRDADGLCELVPVMRAKDWLARRDRAVLAVLAHCGLTAAEIAGLRGADLRLPSAATGQQAVPGQTPAPAYIDVPGRSLEVAQPARTLLEDWLVEREGVLTALRARARAVARVQHTKPAAAALKRPSNLPLFLAREAPQGEPAPLKPVSLHSVVQRALRAIYEALPKSDGYYAHGPAAIRNSVIADWVATLGATEAKKRSGVDVKSRHT
jgi:integrase